MFPFFRLITDGAYGVSNYFHLEVELPAPLIASNDQFCLPERLRCALPLWESTWPPLNLAPGMNYEGAVQLAV